MSDTTVPAKLQDVPATRLRGAVARPRLVVLACVALLSLAGWLYCGLMVAGALRTTGVGMLGPGMGLLETVLGPGVAASPWLAALCSASPADGAGTLPGVALVLAMWIAMTLAMMLPTAAPMLMTYAELCETAARQREPYVAVAVLAAGYVTVWVGFALFATALHIALTALGLLGDGVGIGSRWLAAAVLVAAGLYQFSSLKHACLKACRHPFTFFFANWTAEPRGVFRLGLRQGLHCLGCCWAAMLAMFAVGLMNVVWMALLGALMAGEKLSRGVWLPRVTGAALLIAGAVVGVSG